VGTIELWIRPRWSGNDHLDHWFFSLPGTLRIGKDAADNLRFIIGGDDSEAYQAYNLGSWQAGEWHHVAVTWTIPGRMTTYIDAVPVISHPSRTQDLISSMPAELFVGSLGGSWQARGVIDNLRISGIARAPEQIAASYASDIRPVSLAIEPITSEPFESWRQSAKLQATTNIGIQEYPASQATWSTSDPSVATVNATGVIRAIKAGRATITATIGEVQGSAAIRVKAPRLPRRWSRSTPISRHPRPIACTRWRS
jgi:hypothetical protein